MSITQFVHGQILQGDVLEKLKEIPDDSIDVEITSPPYFSLRDYGIEGQWGKEDTFDEYLDKMIQCMRELKRVLKPSGSCWINIGDSYGSHRSNEDNKIVADKQEQEIIKNYEKSKLLIPYRFAIRCVDELGLICRNDIPWIKENSMPQSIPDRFTNKWEPIFFLVKNTKTICWKHKITKKWTWSKPEINFFNESEKNITWEWKFFERVDRNLGYRVVFNKRTSLYRGFDYYFELDAVRERPKFWDDKESKSRKSTIGTQTSFGEVELKISDNKQDNTLGINGKPLANYKDFNANWKKKLEQGVYGEDKENRARVVAYQNSVKGGNPNGKNPGDIFDEFKWQRHYDENGNCFGCGRHFSKHTVIERAQGSENRDQRQKHDYVWCNPLGKNPGDIFRINPRPFPEAHFATFPIALPLKILKCACPKDGIVLDPFFGAGTVGVAAEMLGLNWKGIELNEEYIKIAKERLEPYNSSRLDDFFT